MDDFEEYPHYDLSSDEISENEKFVLLVILVFLLVFFSTFYALNQYC